MELSHSTWTHKLKFTSWQSCNPSMMSQQLSVLSLFPASRCHLHFLWLLPLSSNDIIPTSTSLSLLSHSSSTASLPGEFLCHIASIQMIQGYLPISKSLITTTNPLLLFLSNIVDSKDQDLDVFGSTSLALLLKL